MEKGPLTAGQLDDFVERGWTLLRQAFPVEVAQAVRHWHVEGLFRHHPWSPEQAVLNLFCFSSVQPGDGGTRLAEGSHPMWPEWYGSPSPTASKPTTSGPR